MKSSIIDLRNRGFVTDIDKQLLAGMAQELLFEKLHSDDAVTRSSAACNLVATDKVAACELLKQLAIEKCLYTRIAICECLEKGNCSTAEQMIGYLGRIGNNRHKVLPKKVSEKKSFPLPRDIIARSLGKMCGEVYPILQTVICGSDVAKIQEVLDAIGFLVFYNKFLATSENAAVILSLLKIYEDNLMIIWKIMLCLSAFPLHESRKVLMEYAQRADMIGKEVQRSLYIWKVRNG